jgi:Lrp/AsnC family transcriptional regulator, regulator for asnA, asnC and gidA
MRHNYGYDNILDCVNLHIIEILSKDSLTPFGEIAKEIGISDATVHNRVRRLVAERIINKFTLSIDNHRLGYEYLAFAGINVRPGHTDTVIEILSNIGEVLEIYEIYGKYDIFAKIRARDLNHMRDTIDDKIGTIPSIVKTELMTALKTNKEEPIISLKKDGSDNGNSVKELNSQIEHRNMILSQI